MAGQPRPILLESADGSAAGTGLEAPAGRYSFLTADPFLVLEADDRGARAEWRASAPAPAGLPGPGTHPFAALRDILERYRVDAHPGLPPFQGGLAGYLGYELGGWLESLPTPPPRDLELPDLHLGAYDWVLAWDHPEGRAWLVSTGLPAEGSQREKRARERLLRARALLEGTATPAVDDRRRKDPGSGSEEEGGVGSSGCNGSPGLHPVEGLAGVRSPFSAAGYREAVDRVRRYIRAGDAFQVNLSQRLQAPLPPREGEQAPSVGLSLYQRLRARNPSPFAAYVATGGGAVVSASPERFLAVRGRRVETRPIKGTARRGVTAEEDPRRKSELQRSEKDRAENVMIVDLLRNDLSKVCRDGSVSAPRICHLETHPTVHHLVSTVQGILRSGVGPAELLEATFPGGSITGAPKIRAMEIIAELEPTRRGAYTGSVGYLAFSGDLDLNIAIRTFQVHDGTAYFPAGGGVVVDSDPDAEYRETLEKARGLASAVEPESP